MRRQFSMRQMFGVGLAFATIGCAPEAGDDSTTAYTMGSGDSADEGDTGGEGEAGEAGEEAGEESGDEGAEAGEGGGSCDFNVQAAIKIGIDVSWDGGIAVVAGGGKINVWINALLDHDGTDIGVTGSVCRISLPDFETGLLADFEKYGTEFPDDIWELPSMPQINALATISHADPGATLHLERGAVILGAALADPLNDPWPADWTAIPSVDHDLDGSPGITAMAKTGSGYSSPRLDPLDPNQRAESLFIASRSILELGGTVDGCDAASGAADFSMENHSLGCNVEGGGQCNGNQNGTLDNNMPKFIVNGGEFQLQAISDGADCAEVFATLP